MYYKISVCLVFFQVLFLKYASVVCENNYDSNKFIRHIFNKYGSKGIINFEGFEHLLENIGLGNIEFSVNHTIDEHRPKGYSFPNWDEMDAGDKLLSKEETWHEIVFQQLHGNEHSHLRAGSKIRIPSGSVKHKTCLSPMSIFRLSTEQLRNKSVEESLSNEDRNTRHVNDDFAINPTLFKEICAALIVQIDGHECDPEPIVYFTNYTRTQAWLYAFSSILIISACGLFGFLLLPLASTKYYNNVLGFLVAIAIGTLLGDAMIHLLPHAFLPHDHNDGNNNKKSLHSDKDNVVFLAVTVLAAAIFMYALENLLPFLSMDGGHHHHHHSHAPVSNKLPEENELKMVNDVDMENHDEIDKEKNKITPAAFMVIIGDGLHNVTDGLAIGAAFSQDPITGFSTALAVVCHELPHEIGDFALLLKTGVSFRKAFNLNIISSVLSIFGMVAGLLLSTEHTANWIYAITAGTFMYVALADLVPELKHNENLSASQVLLQILGVTIGGLIMLVIGLYEDSLRILFDATNE